MAFADPQTITVNAVAQTLNLISSEALKSIYMTADEVYKLTISHQLSGNRARRMIRLDKKVVAADPLTAINAYQQLGMYLVIDEPANQGFTDADVELVRAGFIAFLTQSNVSKLLTGQH